MEEKERYEQLKEILKSIQKTIEMYNELNLGEKISLTTQGEKKDVSNIFICVYNDKHVGLFKKINWSTKICNQNRFSDYAEYSAGSIYVGIDSDYIGMKETHSYNICKNHWQSVGTKIVVSHQSYVCNCTMQNGMSFDDMRLIMYNAGEIGPYEMGRADSKEMLDVLKFSISYYQLEQNVKNQNTK